MSALITNLASVRAQATPSGLVRFYAEQGFSPSSPEPEFGVLIDEVDLYRYGMAKSAADTAQSLSELKAEIGIGSP